MTKIILKAKNIVKTYTEGKVKTDVLKNVNLDIYEGELTAIIGKSGSGKSTLMHILGTLDTADSGQILFNDLDLTRLSASKKLSLETVILALSISSIICLVTSL